MEDILKLKKDFLRDDLRDSLKWLFVGAVVWHAHPLDKDKDYLRAMGMFTALVQARGLYEFFNNSDRKQQIRSGGTARAKDFSPSWKKADDPFELYSKYMANKKPAQRRVFHLVYGRANVAGGSMRGGLELNERVIDFAKDLKRITNEFAASLIGCPEMDEYRRLIEDAMATALVESQELAGSYGIPYPL